MPFSGIPPFNLMGLALTVVMVSKQVKNDTIGARVPLRMISFDKAGFPDTHARLEVIKHVTLSPVTGLYV